MIDAPRKFDLQVMQAHLENLRLSRKAVYEYGGSFGHLDAVILEIEEDLHLAFSLKPYLKDPKIFFWRFANSIYPIFLHGGIEEQFGEHRAVFVRADIPSAPSVTVHTSDSDEEGWRIQCSRGEITEEDEPKLIRFLQESKRWSK